MKILVGKFVLEANENIPYKCDLNNTNLKYGQDCINSMQLSDVFDRDDVTLIPAIYADASSNGVMVKRAFEYIEGTMLDAIKQHINEIDGIYLNLHGASEVEGIGSGDHHILREIRKIVGPYLPIGISCDPHGNLCKEYVENATIIRSYRESPHTDIEETNRFVANALMDQILNPTGIKPVYRKLPLILGGEQSVSADEPVKSINKYLDQLEEDERILSASWHVGYIRHDSDVAGCGVVIIPSSCLYQDYANEIADKLYDYVWDKRHQFHYTGLTAKPNQALQMALECEGKPAFITDSGDNVTSGATGANTFVLRQVLAVEKLEKKVLFAAIHDAKTFNQLDALEIGTKTNISLGANYDELSKPVDLTVEVIQKGKQVGTKLFGESGDFGQGVRVKVENTTIEIIVTNTNHPFVEPEQTESFGCKWDDYDIIIVKTGYAFPEVNRLSKLAVMSLTEGATLQDTSQLKFKRILRPMYPIDNI